MKRLLLDTHIWIWAYLEPHKLSSEVHQAISDPENDCFLSAVSIWEVILLLEKKRIELHEDFGQWFDKSVGDLRLVAVGLTLEVAHELRFTLLGYNDPADRFIAATAKAYDMTLVTADKRLLGLQGLKVLANI